MKKIDSVKINRVKTAIKDGTRARGFHMVFPSPYTIELLGTLDFEFVYIDAEHGCFDMRDIEDACRAAELSDLTVVARIPASRLDIIAQYLDRGVQGIVVPHVSTPEQLERIVETAFYAPKGLRSIAGTRADRFWANVDDFEKHYSQANENVILSIQIEDKPAVEALDEIMSVGGVDYFTIGPNDLAASFGISRVSKDLPQELLTLIASIESRIRSTGGLMKDDVMTVGRVKEFLVGAGRNFLASAQ